MNKLFTLIVACLIVFSMGAVWAVMPSHVGSEDPDLEGWTRNYITGDAMAGPLTGPPAAWYTRCPTPGDQAYYCAAFTAPDLPVDWQMEVQVKAVLATSDEGCFFALGDGTVIWELQVLTATGSGGLYKKTNATSTWVQLAAFEADNAFHTYKVVKYAASDYATVYMDGTAVGQMLASEMYPYTSRIELQLGGGAWMLPSEAQWASFTVTEAPPIAMGNMTATLLFDDFSGDLTLLPVHIVVKQGTNVVKDITQTFESTNQFSVNGLIVGNYDVYVTANKFLTKKTTVTILENQTITPTITLLNGDVDGNNSINTNDLSALLKNLDVNGD